MATYRIMSKQGEDLGTYYIAEVQIADRTLSKEGAAADVAAWLAGWGADGERREAGRPVAVYRLDAEGLVEALVEQRRTLERGTSPVRPAHATVELDARWQAAVAGAR